MTSRSSPSSLIEKVSLVHYSVETFKMGGNADEDTKNEGYRNTNQSKANQFRRSIHQDISLFFSTYQVYRRCLKW